MYSKRVQLEVPSVPAMHGGVDILFLEWIAQVRLAEAY